MRWCLVAVLLTGCGEGTELRGSLRELVDLAYERSVLQFETDQVALRFLRMKGGEEEVVLSVVVKDADDLSLANDLAEAHPQGGQRAAVFRRMPEEPARSFPRIDRGGLRFRQDPFAHRRVDGEVYVAFEPLDQFAGGYTVFGQFSAEVR